MQKSRTQGEGIQEYTKNMDEFLNKLDEYLSDDELTSKEFGEKLERDILRYGKKAVLFVENYLGQIHSIMKNVQ